MLMAFSSEVSFFVPTPTATQDLGLYGLIRMPCTHVPLWDSNRGRKDHQIFVPPLHEGLEGVATLDKVYLHIHGIFIVTNKMRKCLPKISA
jgi:hypothetical protein